MISLIEKWPLFLASFVILIGMEQAGMVNGWSSPLLVRLQAANSTIPTTPAEGAWVATLVSLASMVSTCLAAIASHYLGRKACIGFTTIPLLLSWVIKAASTSITHILISQGLAGFALGFTFTISPMYLGEISTDDVRGGIGMCIMVMQNLGVLLIYQIGTLPDLWMSSVISATPLIIICVFYHWLPESSYFLMMKNRKDDATKELKRLRRSENVEKEIEMIEMTINEQATQQGGLKQLLFESNHRKALLITIGCFTIKQFTGNYAIMAYSHIIFQRAGYTAYDTIATIKAAVELITTIGAAFVVEKIGKRPLMIASCAGSAVFMATEGVYFYLHDNGYNVDNLTWLPLAAMMLFTIFQGFGLTCIPITYLGELFHPKVKSLAVGISKTYLTLAIFSAGQVFQQMMYNFGNCTPFFLFAVVGVVGVVFVVFCIPETKGRSLEEIQYYFKYNCYRDSFQKI